MSNSKSNSMINPSIVELLEKVDNRYSLVVSTSRRARKIIDGEESRVQGIVEIREADDKFTKVQELELVNEEAEEGSNLDE